MKSIAIRLSLSILLILPLAVFQNCGNQSTSNDSPPKSDFFLSQNGSSGGNGGTYDGKLWGRLIPGYTCQDKKAAYGILDLKASFGLLIAGCDGDRFNATQIPLSELEISKFSTDYIGYKDGLYSGSTNLVADIAKGAFTEAFCSTAKSVSGTSEEGEIGLHWRQEGDYAYARHFSVVDAPPEESLVQRRIETDRVRYFSSKYSIEIRLIKTIPGTYKYAGLLTRYTSSGLKKIDLECRMGGRFDPVAPRLQYPAINLTLSLQDPDLKLTPTFNKPGATFSVSPELPTGLKLDPTTGEIFGRPVQVLPRKNYEIKALFEFGEISRSISIGVANRISLNSGCIASTCSWFSVFNDANAQSPNPVIIDLQGTDLTWPAGQEISISGDIEVRGTQFTLDAQGKSRHFRVLSGAHL